MDTTVPKTTFKDLLKWRKERSEKVKDLSYKVPIVEDPDTTFLRANRAQATITWIGHATFLIQLNGLNILIDPVWANGLGFNKRLAPPGFPISELPPIDYVLITHSHYDHLHFASIRRLSGDPTIVVPAGLGHAFTKRKYEKVIECSWWGTFEVNGLTITFVPAQHWSKRTLTDTDRSHWGGWVMKDASHTIYMAGDSGYFDGFQAIGERFEIDYCLMPIGAYEPEWFMGAQHVNPEEAIQAFIDTRSKVMIPMHYGAYRLADDTPKEGLDRLLAEWERRELDDAALTVLKIGETIRIVD